MLGGGGELVNANPTIYAVEDAPDDGGLAHNLDDDDEGESDAFDAGEVFEILRRLRDPEHPLTLEQLNVVSRELIEVDDARNRVVIQFTPTVPHCSMATLIGLCIRVKLLRSLPRRFKVTIMITPGAHASEVAVNKQLADKERVAAALENKHLLDVVDKCIARTDEPGDALLDLARARPFVDPGLKEPFLFASLAA